MGDGISEQLAQLFEPGSVAVIGASNVMTKWGYIVPANILAGGYAGKFYPVNPRETEILERQVYKSIMDIPGKVDLAVVAIPAEKVTPAIKECVEKGVKNCIVISGGFSETGTEGAGLEKVMVDAVKGSSMRLVGPNTMGIYSGPIHLHALMPPVRPVRGKSRLRLRAAIWALRC